MKMENQRKKSFDKLTFLWLLGILLSFTTAIMGIKTQKYNVTRLGSFGMVVTMPFAAKIFLPSEDEIHAQRPRSKHER